MSANQMYIIEVPATGNCDARYHIELTERDSRKFCESFRKYHAECGEPKVMRGGFGLLSMLLRASAEKAGAV